jgi:glycine hydroxymethyltransferase
VIDRTFIRSVADGAAGLADADPTLFALLEREHRRQQQTLAMIASASYADETVLACEASSASNVTTEGRPGARFHAGCEVVDDIERLAAVRASRVFAARYVNVQPHSGTSANQIVLTALLAPGDRIMGQDLASGGHLTHGARASFTGRYFRAAGYQVDRTGRLDYDAIERLARAHRPKVLICGASAYPRVLDFVRFREIADSVGAYLLADISHIAGLVAAGLHPSPIDAAHFTTTSTYKQLYGPRGGLIMLGQDADALGPDGRRSLSTMIQTAVFPYFQGTPRLNTIAAKARCLDIVGSADFCALMRRVVTLASTLADALGEAGWRVVTGGTDSHMVLVDVGARGLSGIVAERSLEMCGVIVNKNTIPGDRRPPTVASGIRFGTNTLALRGMDPAAIRRCAALVDSVWRGVAVHDETSFDLPATLQEQAEAEVRQLCRSFPLPDRITDLAGAVSY